MQRIWAEQALLATGWARDVLLTLEGGRIASVQPGQITGRDGAQRMRRDAQHGIGLTLLPVAYQFGGLDGRALGPGQARFGNGPERFARLVNSAAQAMRALPADAGLCRCRRDARRHLGQIGIGRSARLVVQGGRHIAREAITAAYRAAVRPLRDGL